MGKIGGRLQKRGEIIRGGRRRLGSGRFICALRRRVLNLPLRTAFVTYTAVFLLLACLTAWVTIDLAYNICDDIYRAYLVEEVGYKEKTQLIDGKMRVVELIPTKNAYEQKGKPDGLLYRALRRYCEIAPFLVFMLYVVAAAFFFYRVKVKRPLFLLTRAAERIAHSDLSEPVRYERTDEMGRLCASFERMRMALVENNGEIARQLEERRRLNAAFSHDLRTPLTVLKGDCELLRMTDEALSDDERMRLYENMSVHVARMEEYVVAMSALRRLEDIDVRAREISLDVLGDVLQEEGKALCGEKAFALCLQGGMACVDAVLVEQVFGNLIVNAARYATQEITATLAVEAQQVCLTVEDDGPGFSQEALSRGTDPFFRADDQEDGGHFGMGLNICKILCERHGGNISLENGARGARVCAQFAQRIDARTHT